MNLFAVNIAVLLIGINLLIWLPKLFRNKNAKVAAQEEFDEYWAEMEALDKHYAPHLQQLNKHLNTINYWLRNGLDPTLTEENIERLEQEDRFFSGLMTPFEIKKWKESERMVRTEDKMDPSVKEIRVTEFSCIDMDPEDVNQTEMDFVYAPDYDDCIYYCVTPEAAEKKLYRNIIYFTTARPTSIPMVYPYKYEGAQMLSLYKHPAQTVWFLKNWKIIREGLEGGPHEELFDLDDSVADFDL